MPLRWAFKLIAIQIFSFIVITFANAQATSSNNNHGSQQLGQPTGPIVLEVHGKINKTNHENTALFDIEMLFHLPEHQLTTSTVVTDGKHQFKGFLLTDLLEYLQVYGNTITATALNDYAVKIDRQELYDFNVIVAYEMDGKRLHTSDKGPLWIVYPRDDYKELQDIRYDYRWVWQLYRLDID